MRCLITGATGHLGSFVTRYLLSKGDEVAILVRSTSDCWRLTDVLDQVQLIKGDLSAIEESRAQIEEFAAEALIHLGWCGVVSADRNDAALVMDNLVGSLALLQIVQAGGAHTFIGVGSQAEYGIPAEVLTEETAVRPTTIYGVTKLSVGLLSRELCNSFGIRHVWIRLLATYGPMDDARRLIPSVIKDLLTGKKPSLTSGEQRWDYLYIDDCVAAIDLALRSDQSQGIYVLGSDRTSTIKEIVERIRDTINPALPLGWGEIPYGSQQIMHLQADSSRFRKVTGWVPQVDLTTGLQRTIDWYRDAISTTHRIQ